MAAGDVLPEVLGEVCSAFDLQVRRLEQLRKVFKVHTATGSYGLKWVNPVKAKVRFIFRVVEHLRKMGLDAAVPFLLTKSGEPLYIQGEVGYVLTPWVEGREADFRAWGELASAVELMGRLHRASEGFHPPEGEWVRNVLGHWPLRWKSAVAELQELVKEQNYPSAGDFMIAVRPLLPELITQGMQALELLARRGNYRLQVEKARARRFLCHRDLVYHNLIVDKFGGLHVIDFEYAALEMPIGDVGRFFWKALPETGWDWPKVKSLLGTYQDVFPLTTEDKWLLLAYLTFPHNWWRLVRRYKEGAQMPNSFLHQLKNQMNQEEERRVFLQEMTRDMQSSGGK